MGRVELPHSSQHFGSSWRLRRCLIDQASVWVGAIRNSCISITEGPDRRHRPAWKRIEVKLHGTPLTACCVAAAPPSRRRALGWITSSQRCTASSFSQEDSLASSPRLAQFDASEYAVRNNQINVMGSAANFHVQRLRLVHCQPHLSAHKSSTARFVPGPPPPSGPESRVTTPMTRIPESLSESRRLVIPSLNMTRASP